MLDVNTLIMLVPYAILVGIVFSAIGAAGGILTSFGLITLFGVLDPNAVKPMTQVVVLAAALVFVPGYLKRREVVLPLGLLLGAGGLVGAFIGSTLSSHYLSDMATFRPVFGALTLAVAAQIIWKLARPGAKPAPVPVNCAGIEHMKIGLGGLHFSYCQNPYHVPLWSPLLAGLIIAMIAAIFGVGGGFLLVPYMATILTMPMHIIPATAAISIFMASTVSISNFIRLGAPLEWNMLIPMVIGVAIGALIGPVVNKRMKNAWLQGALAVIVIGIGLKYTLF